VCSPSREEYSASGPSASDDAFDVGLSVRIKGLPVTRMTSERCDRDVWTGTFAHECSVNHSCSNLGECVRRCVEVALEFSRHR
jgi:hypothetical protein